MNSDNVRHNYEQDLPDLAQEVAERYLPSYQQWSLSSNKDSYYITEIALLLIKLLEQIPITL